MMLSRRSPRQAAPGCDRQRTRNRASHHGGTGKNARWRGAAAPIAVIGASLAAGCAAPASAGPVIQLTAAAITQPGASRITDVYVDVSNNGPATKLISARISAGGRITFRSPIRPGQTMMETVSAIGIPAKSFLRLGPDSSHMLVTDAGPMKSGTEITLTLVFAHAGAFSVPMMVTNPQSGGASYFLN
jgi:copper(I)-binding protein